MKEHFLVRPITTKLKIIKTKFQIFNCEWHRKLKKKKTTHHKNCKKQRKKCENKDNYLTNTLDYNKLWIIKWIKCFYQLLLLLFLLVLLLL